MRTLVLALAILPMLGAVANAADYREPRPDPFEEPLRGSIPPEPVPPPSWTGAYIGANLGWGGGTDKYDLAPVGGSSIGTLALNSSGVAGGGQLGFNYAIQNFVVGLETDIAGTAISDRTDFSLFGAPVLQGGSKLNYIGTVRARVGYSIGPTLLYVTGGFAYADSSTRIDLNGLGSTDTNRMHIGYSVGGGVEYALTPAVSLRTEYLRAELDRKRLTTTANNGGAFEATHKPTVNLVRAGVNFRFPTLVPQMAYAPVVARY